MNLQQPHFRASIVFAINDIYQIAVCAIVWMYHYLNTLKTAPFLKRFTVPSTKRLCCIQPKALYMMVRSPGATCGGLRSRHAPSPPFCEELTSGRWAGECQRSSKAEPLPPTFRRPTLSPLLAIVTSRVLLPPRLHRRTGECKRSTAPRPPRIHLS